MRCAKNNVDSIRVFLHNTGQGFQGSFYAFIGTEQSEGKKNRQPFHIELFLVKVGINKRHVMNAMVYYRDLVLRDLIYVVQHPGPLLTHRDKSLGAIDDVLKGFSVICERIFQNRVYSRYYR